MDKSVKSVDQHLYHSINTNKRTLPLHLAGSYIYITGLREASDRGLAMVLLGFLMFTPGR